MARAFNDQYRYAGRYPYDYAAPGAPPDILVSEDGTHGEWAGTEWQFNAKISAEHTVIAGGEFRESFHEEQFNRYTSEDDVRIDSSSRVWGAFAQWEATLRKDLRLSAGGRYDHYQGSSAARSTRGLRSSIISTR